MAANFKICVRRHNDSVHLKLTGNFDGNSAYELLNLIKKICKGALDVFIHTDHLKQIYPFGRNVFHNNLHLLENRAVRLVLTGSNAARMVHERHGLPENAGPFLIQMDSGLLPSE